MSTHRGTDRPSDRPTDRATISELPVDRVDTGTDGEGRCTVWPVVAVREVAVKLRDRNFLISTAVLLGLLVASLGLQVLLAQRSGSTTVAVPSQAASTLVRQAGTAARHSGTQVSFDVRRVGSTEAVERAVKAGEADAGLVPSGEGWRLVGDSERDTAVASWVGQSVRQDAIARNADAAGTTLHQLSRGSAVPYQLLTAKADRHPSPTIPSAVFGLLFYIAALVFGTAIANSVVEEKQNRVVEILAAAIPTRQLLVGKVVGNTLLALAQVALIAVIGAGGLAVTHNTELLGQLTGGVGWFLAFFLLGFAALACLWAVVGAMASRAEDIQSTSPPMTVLVMVIFFLGILSSGRALEVISYVPLLSTIAMPTRVITGDATWWQAVLSLGCSAFGAYLIIRVAERAYRRTLMQTGRRSSLREAMGLGKAQTTAG